MRFHQHLSALMLTGFLSVITVANVAQAAPDQIEQVDRILSAETSLKNATRQQLLSQKVILNSHLRRHAGRKDPRRIAVIRRLQHINAQLRQRRTAGYSKLARKLKIEAGPADLKALQDNRLPQNLSTQQLQLRIGKLKRILQLPDIRRYQRQRAQAFLKRDVRQLRARARMNVPQGVATVLTDRRPSRSLTTPMLRTRIQKLDRFLLTPGLQAGQRQNARRLRARDRKELNRRRVVVPQQQSSGHDVLQDSRPAARLTDAQLRARVGKLRAQLQRGNLPVLNRRQLSLKLSSDRRELRRRVAANRAHQRGRQYQPLQPEQAEPGSQRQARALLRDYRDAQGLSKVQLRRRIKAGREVLKYVALTHEQRARLTNMLRADRQEKRRRLMAARQQRQAELRRLRQRGALDWQVQRQRDYTPQGDIAAAEADERSIRRQLLAQRAKRFQRDRRLARRYSREEIARRPDLTRQFAGIDVDTINFGFNEYWIREEEIDELEQMAIAIEQILAVRPGEVFQIEGHTDAVGSDAYNLQLSRQRARAVKQALIRFFVIPPHSLIAVGLGERYLKIPTPDPEAENRRVTVRRITSLLR